MASSAPKTATVRTVDPALSKMLELCPSALLSFDDGTSLPVSRELLMFASPMLLDMLTSTQLAAGPGGVPIIPLPGDRRDDWLLVLPFLYHCNPEVTWGNVEPLTELCIKYDLQGLRPYLDKFLAASAAAVNKQLATCDLKCYKRGFAPSIKLSTMRIPAQDQWSLWRWLELAGRCRLGASVEAFCDAIVEGRLVVPKNFDLGLAAQPLAVKLSQKLRSST